ncbi:PREDICTED: uncharacterized protein LOC109485558 [Branchiostoma belcheri]|uniref:Uncharacterized protein LOC109485558 n=1 Tax=Branchiostoma belcheri TaxID=7741 RepID=A0A6P5ANZ8_BRABE|nr:PREDICTED: uncharacterized protein LOC109485558 [Branchiostoma belcheri]
MADFGLTVYTCIGLQNDVLREALTQITVGYPRILEESSGGGLHATQYLLPVHGDVCNTGHVLLVHKSGFPVLAVVLADWSRGTQRHGSGPEHSIPHHAGQSGAGLWKTYFSSAAQFVGHLIFTILTSIVLTSHLQNLRKGLGKNLRIYFSSLVPRDLTTHTNHGYRTRTGEEVYEDVRNPGRTASQRSTTKTDDYYTYPMVPLPPPRPRPLAKPPSGLPEPEASGDVPGPEASGDVPGLEDRPLSGEYLDLNPSVYQDLRPTVYQGLQKN